MCWKSDYMYQLSFTPHLLISWRPQPSLWPFRPVQRSRSVLYLLETREGSISSQDRVISLLSIPVRGRGPSLLTEGTEAGRTFWRSQRRRHKGDATNEKTRGTSPSQRGKHQRESQMGNTSNKHTSKIAESIAKEARSDRTR